MSLASLRRAGGSVMVTVPPVYLKETGLTVGAIVNLEVRGNELRVTPGKKKITLQDILAAAPKDAHKLREPGWDEMRPAGNER